ncbi:S1 RNA-binding domain-containing protein [Gemella sanguinis]|uniref:General stress protein n=1 Tax=Gemella sanguinis TaxID=84135 RepID=A0A2N6SFF4_9BACL|nr:S1 RNA-binding domain-containing protein [Gemella sanguinis]PMC52674.1 general stress protein [Gemella sanguinis]
MSYKEIAPGDIIKVKVTAVKPYGAFIETRDGQVGLIHISEITNCFIFDISSYIKQDEILEVKVLSIKDNKINATLNFKQKKSSNKKEINSLDTLNFLYGFDTIKRNMKFWQKKAMIEMRNSK